MQKWVPVNGLVRWKIPKIRICDNLFARIAVILVMAVFCFPAVTFSQTVTFSGKNVRLQQAFDAINKQTDYVVVYNPDRIDTNAVISVTAKKLPLEQFLKSVLSVHTLAYTIVGTTIVVFQNADNISGADHSFSRDISGVVFDEKSGGPLSGVSIVVNGAGKGGQTDGKGMFLIRNVRKTDSISLSFIGYEPVTLPVKNMSENGVTVAMTITTNELDQAVVQGYGITSKRLATGNIGRVTAAEIEKQPVMNPLLALQGRVPGLIVTQTTGHAASPVKVQIRGRNSINPNALSDPLYIVDGLPLTVLDVSGAAQYGMGVSPGFVQGGLSNTQGQSPLFSFNPLDIESIEVLKDGDATAIYGSRGANGVILITTKKARAGKTSLSLGATQGVMDVDRRWSMLNTQQYLQMRREAFKNDGLTPTAANAPDLLVWDTTRQTDWQKELLGKGSQTSFTAGISGGDNQTTFSLNGNYMKQVDVLNRSGSNQRSTVSFNVNHRSPNQKLTVSMSANYGYTSVDAINDRSGIFNLPPNAPSIFDEKGDLNYAEWNNANVGNLFPFSYILTPSISKTNNLSSSLNISYEIIRGLSAVVSAGYGNAQNTNNYFTPIASQNPLIIPTGFASFGTTKNTNRIVEPQLKYSTFIGKGNLSVQAGGSLQSVSTNGESTLAFGYTNDDLLNSVSNATFQQVSEGYSDYKYAALFGRLNYNWDNKYILNFNVRRDGSSRFGDARQFGNFGSVGAAWIASEENWMKKILPSWFDFIKIRGSYAITGSDGIGDYQSLSQWGVGRDAFSPLYNYDGIRPFIPIHAVNQDYRWEANKKSEAAINLGFLHEMINVELAYYQNSSGNQLTQIPTPVFSGFPSVTANWAANVRNSGFEGMINLKLIAKKNFSWTVNLNVGANRNKLLAYPGIESSPYFGTYKVGRSLTTMYYLHYLGINPQTGQNSFADFNHDGVARINTGVSPGTQDDDRYVAVDPTPRYSGGAGTQFGFRGFNLTLFFNFKKQLGINPFANVTPGRMTNLPTEALDNRWTKPGDIARYSRYSTIDGSLLSSSDGNFIDASYVRLANVAFSYALPGKIVQKTGMNDCRLFVNAQNIFTITGYTGIDPEVQGIGSLPSARTITGGISFNF